jgi:hypothetical protein
MNVMAWSKSTVDYGRKLVDSAADGIRTGEDEFLVDGRLTPYLAKGATRSLAPAAIGAVLGAYCGSLRHGCRSTARILTGCILGGLVGFGAGMVWETRYLTESIGTNVHKRVQSARDEHWLEENPIDYA